MQKSNYEVEVLVNGHPIQEYFKDGKHYIEARKSNEFSLRIRNNGSKRIVALPSVDGLSVLDGKEANMNSQGYIINGYDSLTIDGWRVSDSEVRKFFFTYPENSYAKRKNNGDNLGIIGVAIFREKETHVCPNPIIFHDFYPKRQQPWETWPWNEPPWPPFYSDSDNIPDNKFLCAQNVNEVKMMSVQDSAVSQEVGTGWGEEKLSNVISVSFVKENSPDAVFEIYYNTKEQLKKMGVDFGRKPQYVSPQAFPGKYCEPPKQ